MTRIGSYFDLMLVETLNGGSLQQMGNDVAVIYGNENQPYLAMFGGNVDQSSWWGNNLLYRDQPDRQFNSLTEYTLNTTALTSAGRSKIEAAIRKDLQYMKPSLVQVSIVSDNKVTVLIQGDFGEKIINFVKRTANGDFWFADFNNDFY